jgi:hypothetical protein
VGRIGLGLGAAGGAPSLAMLADPIEKRALEADVVAETFGLDPFMAKDLLPLGEKLLVKAGLLYEVPGGFRRLGGSVGHGYHGKGLS